MKNPITLIVGPNDGGRRIDRLISIWAPQLARTLIFKALRQGRIRLNNQKCQADQRVIVGDKITIDSYLLATSANAKTNNNELTNDTTYTVPAELIVLETPDLLFCNKPAGLASHGEASIAELLDPYLSQFNQNDLAFKPAPLHRLDRNTSGIITFSKSLRGAQAFTAALREHSIHKNYLAIVEGLVTDDTGTWTDYLVRDSTIKKTFVQNNFHNNLHNGEKKFLARLSFRVLARAAKENCSLLLIKLETGYTHQIRAQASFHGHPLWADKKYGAKKSENENYFLHAFELELAALSKLELPTQLRAPLPALFETKIIEFFSQDILTVIYKK